ncbi:hypothetical protein Tco_0682312 [Tanacetum coccineum]|uniref:Uncharacterized protein n=1 Tax=Tanacetum coccineum TaxID=301880 RepID=A0ABQ4XRU6_9ASTR
MEGELRVKRKGMYLLIPMMMEGEWRGNGERGRGRALCFIWREKGGKGRCVYKGRAKSKRQNLVSSNSNDDGRKVEGRRRERQRSESEREMTMAMRVDTREY